MCLQCHLQTSNLPLPSSVVRSNRGPFSYVPGEALGDFRISFDRAGPPEDRMEVAHAAYRLMESQCYRKSEGKLRCTYLSRSAQGRERRSRRGTLQLGVPLLPPGGTPAGGSGGQAYARWRMHRLPYAGAENR